jgi:hypothetical protein
MKHLSHGGRRNGPNSKHALPHSSLKCNRCANLYRYTIIVQLQLRVKRFQNTEKLFYLATRITHSPRPFRVTADKAALGGI